MLGESSSFQQLLATLKQIARFDAAVLLEGETGTGKELAARALHYDGPRRAKPFLPINCGALQDSLVENELFGHCRGAYTGAQTDERGLVEAADGGTLFLDEVDALTPKAQVTLLRFLEDQQFRPVGGRTHRTANVRVIAASNRSLGDLVEKDRFRLDLLYRLRVMHVRVPPLRERAGDATLLAQHFLQMYSTRFSKPVLPLSASSIGWIDTYQWPGNIRELENIICQAFLLSPGPEVEVAPLAAGSSLQEGESWSYRRAKQRALAEFERRFLMRAIKCTAGNVSQAARLINTERRHLGRLLKKHGLEPLALVPTRRAR